VKGGGGVGRKREKVNKQDYTRMLLLPNPYFLSGTPSILCQRGKNEPSGNKQQEAGFKKSIDKDAGFKFL
jgi:hypothetical protein